MARVLQINISPGGLPKTSIARASVTELGIEGDAHRFQYHGGPNKALLLASSELIEVLRVEGWPLFYGALGENLTTAGLDAKLWRAGQRFRVGSVVLRLTQPRGPCRTLDCYGPGIQERIFDSRVKSHDASSPKWGYSGFYAAVIQPGAIEIDDIIEAVNNHA